MAHMLSPFAERQFAAGARFTEFAGLAVPSSFGEVGVEYWACRERSVVLDATGQYVLRVEGPGACRLLQRATTRDIESIRPGSVVLVALCEPRGSLVDLGTVFCRELERYWFVGDSPDTLSWLARWAEEWALEVELRSLRGQVAALSVQGPSSLQVVEGVLEPEPGSIPVGCLRWFEASRAVLVGDDSRSLVVSRTGFTGEVGYEVWCSTADALALWDSVAVAGTGKGLVPAGLDVCHVLRVEAGLPFPGIDYDGTCDPFEAGLGSAVDARKAADYLGKVALERRQRHPTRRLVGLRVEAGSPPVPGSMVLQQGRPAGTITSGTFSPVLGASLAFAMVDIVAAIPGQPVKVESGAGWSWLEGRVGALRSYDPCRRKVRG